MLTLWSVITAHFTSAGVGAGFLSCGAARTAGAIVRAAPASRTSFFIRDFLLQVVGAPALHIRNARRAVKTVAVPLHRDHAARLRLRSEENHPINYIRRSANHVCNTEKWLRLRTAECIIAPLTWRFVYIAGRNRL